MFVLAEGSEQEQRRNIARTLRLRARLERGVRRRIAKFLRQQGERMLEALTSAPTVEEGEYRAMQELQQSLSALTRVVRGVQSATIEVFGRQAMEEVGKSAMVRLVHKDADTSFAALRDRYVQEQGLVKAKAINETTRERWRRRIRGVLREGGGEREVVQELRKLITGARNRRRAWTIARTEVHAASVFAVHAGLKATGFRPDKKWSTTLDGRERASHRAANAQIVKFDEDFIIEGERLAYPGDPRGSARNVVNCRCMVMYVPPQVKPRVVVPQERPVVAAPQEGNLPPDIAENLDFEWRMTFSESIGVEEARKRVEKAIQDFMDKNPDIYRTTNFGTLLKVLDEGRFKSQFETNISSGVLAPEFRRKVESKVLGVADDIPVEQRPIYGFMSTDPFRERSALNYGGGDGSVPYKVVVKFKKDVSKRTTYTIGDSLDSSGLYDKQTPSLRAAPVGTPRWYTAESRVANAVIENEIDFDDIDKRINKYISYIEVQIHGGVTVDDIAEVLIPKRMRQSMLGSMLTRKLNQLGIPYRFVGSV